MRTRKIVLCRALSNPGWKPKEQPGSWLLTLPWEVREKIYNYVYHEDLEQPAVRFSSPDLEDRQEALDNKFQPLWLF